MADDIHLEMSYHRDKLMAAYLYLPRKEGDRAARSREARPGLVVDYAEDGRPIGIEIVSPSAISEALINDVLADIGQAPLTEEDLAPLRRTQAASGGRRQ